MVKLERGQEFVVPYGYVGTTQQTFRAQCHNIAKALGYKVSITRQDDGYRIVRLDLVA